MILTFRINSLYVCVKDMERTIEFYEKLFEQNESILSIKFKDKTLYII